MKGETLMKLKSFTFTTAAITCAGVLSQRLDEAM
jgi:hypothetical protein